jgi:hypothetical protein
VGLDEEEVPGETVERVQQQTFDVVLRMAVLVGSPSRFFGFEMY